MSGNRPDDPDPEYVRDVSEFVYRSRLSLRQLAALNRADDAQRRIRRNAAAFDSMTRVYLEAIKLLGEPT